MSSRTLSPPAVMPAASQAGRFETVDIEGITVLVPKPYQPPALPFLGREELVTDIRSALAANLHVMLLGPPGSGKNALTYAAAAVEEKDLFELKGHTELQPDDIAMAGRLGSGRRIEYVASPLFAAMWRGASILYFDEIGKVPERSLSLLSSVLDQRRSLTAHLAGLTIEAAAGFRFIASRNDSDLAMNPPPDWLLDRDWATFRVDFPSAREVVEIVKAHLPNASGQLLDALREWLVDRRQPVSPRAALSAFRLAEQFLNGSSHPGAARTAVLKAASFTIPQSQPEPNP